MYRYRPGHSLKLVTMLVYGYTTLLVLYVICSDAVSAQPHVSEFALSSMNNSAINCPGPNSSSMLTPGLPGAICLAPPTQESNIIFGRCLYRNPIQFSKLANASFSTMFSFTTLRFPLYQEGQGFTFFIGPDNSAPGNAGEGYLGWLNSTTNGNTSGRNFAVEFDLVSNQFTGFLDPSYHHVGINVNSLHSVLVSSEASAAEFNNFTSYSSIQRNLFAWIDYDGEVGKIEVRVSRKPRKPCKILLSGPVNLSNILLGGPRYMGFSSSSGGNQFNAQTTIWDWSFSATGQQAENIYSSDAYCGFIFTKIYILVSVIAVMGITLCLFLVLILVLHQRTRKLSDLDKEKSLLIEELKHLDYGAREFTYQDMLEVTQGFHKIIGNGGYGTVYKGNLAYLKWSKQSKTQNTLVAVKKIKRTSHSVEDVKQMASEVKVIGRLRHNNIVPLLGWCYDRGEMLIVYKYMENGDVDMHLFPANYGTPGREVLSWEKRMRTLKGVAKALVFLHEDFQCGVVHRDIKTRNVMLDHDFNPLLGDFGLARLHESKGNIHYSHNLEGTRGYIAPEYMEIGATSETDVYSFGIMTLVVVTGRPVIDQEKIPGGLLKWVRHMYDEGTIATCADINLKTDKTFIMQEMEKVLKVGLFCCLFKPAERPSMSEVLVALNGTSSILSSSLPPQTPEQISSQLTKLFMSMLSNNENSMAVSTEFERVSEYLAKRSNTRPRFDHDDQD